MRIFIVMICSIFILSLSGCVSDNNENNAVNADGTNSETFSGEFSETIQETGSEADEIEWNEITEEGVNEELFLENLDTELLVKIAGNIQALIEEEVSDEQANPQIVLAEGWTRIFKKEKYAEVINIGKPAMKPLYWILYKSENKGQYEYICAKALQEISGIGAAAGDGTMEWSTSDEYLELFTKEILRQR